MIRKGDELETQAFHPCFIYNSYKFTCQEQAENLPVLTCPKRLIPAVVLHT